MPYYGPHGVWALRLAIVAVSLVALGPLLAHLRVAPPLAGFVAYAIGGCVGHVALFSGLVASRRCPGRRATIAAWCGLAAAVALLVPTIRGVTTPRLNDVTSDVVDPPAFRHPSTLEANAGDDLGYPEALKAEVQRIYPEVASLALTDRPRAVFGRIVEMAGEIDSWTVIDADWNAMRLEGYAETPVFRFREDFVVRLKASAAGTVVDMRSRSRGPLPDVGSNAKRIQAFLARLRLSRP